MSETPNADAADWSSETRATLVLEEYRLYVEMADKVSDRRQGANSYFLTVHTAALAVVGVFAAQDAQQFLWLLGIAGMVLAFLWYRLVASYRDLNTAKFKVIHELEQLLPVQPYAREWILVGEGRDPTKYRPISHVEVGVPWIFLLLHGTVVLRTVPWERLLSYLGG